MHYQPTGSTGYNKIRELLFEQIFIMILWYTQTQTNLPIVE